MLERWDAEASTPAAKGAGEDITNDSFKHAGILEAEIFTVIISASRRTDIPAFYARWFMNRLRGGLCHVVNPFNPNQVSAVSLKPEDVDVIVFWTRYARPMLPYLKELDRQGYRYYFLYTLVNHPRSIDVKSPPFHVSLQSFRKLAERIGPDRVIWRYDPIFFTTETDAEFHVQTYRYIAQRLKGFTHRSVISLATLYRKLNNRLQAMKGKGVEALSPDEESAANLLRILSQVAADHAMEIFSCAQEADWTACGIRPGKCVDDRYIEKIFGLKVTRKKDPSQRKTCGCIVSKDVGMYNTCLFECAYCYATTSFELARRNYQRHNPHGLSLISPATE